MVARFDVPIRALAMWSFLLSTRANPIDNAPESMITPAPELKKRADAYWRDDFIGYLSKPGASMCKI
jgi:hypothetical protein